MRPFYDGLGAAPVARRAAFGGYLALGKWLRPEDQPRELLSDHPQLVFRADFVEPVQGLTLNQAVEKMRGPENSKIKLKIHAQGPGEAD